MRGTSRGAQVTGPVWLRGADRLRALRYEVRCWEGGVISDLDWRIGPAVRVSSRADEARRVLAQAAHVPAHTWGRRAAGEAEMWNSNSATAWILASAGLHTDDLAPPDGGRAPGWTAGINGAPVDIATKAES